MVHSCSGDGFAILRRPYLLVTFIPVYKDQGGGLWLERLWHHDLIRHLDYLADFRLCAPVLPKDGDQDLLRIDAPPGHQLRVISLPVQNSYAKALLSLPSIILTLWRSIGDTAIVHSGVVGWPYPLGWIVNPLAKIRGKALIIVVESSWLRTDRRNWKIAILNAVSGVMARWSCNHADVSFYTQPTYRDTLLARPGTTAYVTPAVWINEVDALDETSAYKLWQLKLLQPVRLLFAGRLVAGKGIDVLLAALKLLEKRESRVQVDIIGEGERRGECVKAGREFRTVGLSVLDSVPYGEEFFKILRRYHALLVPSLTDEQPRIVFDASAQALPLIASDTAGLRPHVDHDRTGWLVPSGDSEALALIIERASAEAPKLRSMGMQALQGVQDHTHAAMHRTRSQILMKHLGSTARS